MSTLTTQTTSRRRNRLVRLIAAFILGMSGAAVAGVAMAAPADAASCSGSLGFRLAKSTGELVIYYSTASGGTNCAQMNHLGSTYGVASPTSVSIVKCTQTVPTNFCTYTGSVVDDYDNYAYYAGPVKLTSMNGKCVYAQGWDYYNEYYVPGAVMCG